jgi:hypothetical protein
LGSPESGITPHADRGREEALKKSRRLFGCAEDITTRRPLYATGLAFIRLGGRSSGLPRLQKHSTFTRLEKARMNKLAENLEAVAVLEGHG